MLLAALVGALLCLAMMARRGRGRRKYRRYLKGTFQEFKDLSTLSSNSLTGDTVSDVLTEPAWLSSVKCTWSLTNYTNTNLAGPLLVGFAHSDYTDAEIEEWVENLASWDSGNMIAQEKSRRKIRLVGQFQTESTGGTGPNTVYVLNDGKPITTKCGWLLIGGQTLKAWFYNSGGVAFASTSPRVKWTGHANLWPT